MILLFGINTFSGSTAHGTDNSSLIASGEPGNFLVPQITACMCVLSQ